MADENRVDSFRLKPEHLLDVAQVISFLVARLGAKYDYVGVTWLGILKLVSHLPGVKAKPYNRFQKEKDYFCSELCYAAFLSGGVDIVPQVDEAEVTSPGDIAESERLEKIVSTSVTVGAGGGT